MGILRDMRKKKEKRKKRNKKKKKKKKKKITFRKLKRETEAFVTKSDSSAGLGQDPIFQHVGSVGVRTVGHRVKTEL